MIKNKISVIIPFKNEEKFLQECLTSVSIQKVKGVVFEVLLIDDHSDDASPRIAKEFERENPIFSYHLNAGNGVIDALQMGLKFSTGNYIHRMDADDIMPENKLATLFHLLKENPNIKIATGKVSYFRNDAPLGKGFENYETWLNLLVENSSFYDDIYKECPFASANWMMTKKTLVAIGGFGKRYPEDYDLAFRACQANLPILGSPKITHRWRDHHGRASRNIAHYQDNNFFELKIDWFISLHCDCSKTLYLYGAGKKGKHVARLLLKKDLKLRWFTNNINKIGKVIYGIKLESDALVFEVENSQILLAISSPEENKKIQLSFSNHSLVKGSDFFVLT